MSEVITKSIDHLGLVAGMIEELEKIFSKVVHFRIAQVVQFGIAVDKQREKEK